MRMKEPVKLVLRDGRDCLLRSPDGADAAEILRHMRVTSQQTDYMMRYADEITAGVEEERDYLERIAASRDSMQLSAFVDGALAANAGFSPVAPVFRLHHRSLMGLSVKEEYWGLGIGRALITTMMEKAAALGYLQMELDVVAANARAMALYESLGFKTYGTLEKAFGYRDGHFETVHSMVCKLSRTARSDAE